MEARILAALCLRPWMEGNESILGDMVTDCISEIKDLLNYPEGDPLPQPLEGLVKDMVAERFNRMGAEGLSSESHSGISQSYTDGLTKKQRMRIYKYRRLRR